MDPLKYRHPIFVHPPFRDDLNAALRRRVGEEGVGNVDRILPLLDGTNTPADIYGRLAIEGVSPALVAGVLEVLDGLGSLSDTPEDTDVAPLAGEMVRYRDQVACLRSWFEVRQGPEEATQAATAAQATLGTSRVVVMGLGRCGAALIEALAIAGVGYLRGLRADPESASEAVSAAGIAARVSELNPRVSYSESAAVEEGEFGESGEGRVRPLLVYCPEAFRDEVVLELNRVALATGASLLPYRETPFSVEIGPLVVPGQTACYACFDLRRRAAEPKASPVDEPISGEVPALGFAAGVPLLALEVIKILTRAAFPVSRGKLWRLGLFDGSVGVHPVLKLPRCPECGSHRRTPPRRIWEE